MITVRNRFFLLETENSSYVMSYTDSGLLLHHYYGKKTDFYDFKPIMKKTAGGFGTSVLYEGNLNEHIDHLELEFSSAGIGDFREPSILMFYKSKGFSLNFKYDGYEILEADNTPLPHSYGESHVLKINLFDSVWQLKAELYYKIFETSDVISRYIRIVNCSDNEYYLQRLYSLQLDFPNSNFFMMTFDGSWAKERHLHERKLAEGITVNDSKTGSSSNKHNPLVIFRKENTSESFGECIGINLVYSGNHKTIAEVSESKKLRILSGINDFAFSYTLKPNTEFISPEAVFTYSNNGLNRMSQNFHNFVNHHIIRGKYANKERPILINSWEASYFKFNEKKLLKLAKTASNLGVELFVLDDGWFGKRDNDRSSLGDWEVNGKKLPNGLKGLADKINTYGMDFGLWVEPEMINEDSELFRAHSEWAVKIPGRKPGICRNQMILDLTNPEVQKFLIDKLSDVFSECNLKYVKWDYNRNITDMYGMTLENQGEFFHRYILGFYQIIKVLTHKFPHILFEGCASGGNRFDLGMLCFFPQIWTSDDTDYLERVYIQSGTSYGYPLSAISNHISGVPNHQTLRTTPLSSRFHIACFGNLGYELDLNELTKDELSEIKNQIHFYKKHRNLFQYGVFYRGENSIFNFNSTYFYVISDNKNEGVIGFFQSLLHPAMPEDILKIFGLDNDLYSFRNINQKQNLKKFGGLINLVSPIKIKLNGKIYNLICRLYRPNSENENYLAYGNAFRDAGVRLTQQFMGTGYSNQVRVIGDFGTRMYTIRKVKPKYQLSKTNIAEYKKANR